MSARGKRLFTWVSIHFTVVPILFYQVHQFGYDKGYKIGLKEGKNKLANNDGKKNEMNNVINNQLTLQDS